jgi:hypothetical protein
MSSVRTAEVRMIPHRIRPMQPRCRGRPSSRMAPCATLGAITCRLHEVLAIPPGAGRLALYALTRRFHGDDMGDAEGLVSRTHIEHSSVRCSDPVT